MGRLTFDGLFCDIAKCNETPGGTFCEKGSCSQRKVWERLKEYEDMEEQGRLVVLPFALGATLIDRSDPERPELLKNFRLALAYDHNGIVFHQPLGIFLENVQRGYIAQVSEEAERVLEGGVDNGT